MSNNNSAEDAGAKAAPKTTTRSSKKAAAPTTDFFANLKARSSSLQKIAAGLAGDTEEAAPTENIELLALAAIQPNPNQPRKQASPKEDAELAEDVRQRGILQPIIVRPLPQASPDNRQYELVAGERRCQAARAAGLTVIPAIVKAYDDREARTVAAIENLQRKNLAPADEAGYFQFLAQEYNLSNRDIAQLINKSPSYVDQRLRLLKVADERVKNTQMLENSQSEAASDLPAKPWKYKPKEWDRFKALLDFTKTGYTQAKPEEKEHLRQAVRDLQKTLAELEKELNP